MAKDKKEAAESDSRSAPHFMGMTRTDWLRSFQCGERRFVEIKSRKDAAWETKQYHSRICELKPNTFSVELMLAVSIRGDLSDPTVGLLCVTRTDGVIQTKQESEAL